MRGRSPAEHIRASAHTASGTRNRRPRRTHVLSRRWVTSGAGPADRSPYLWLSSLAACSASSLTRTDRPRTSERCEARSGPTGMRPGGRTSTSSETPRSESLERGDPHGATITSRRFTDRATTASSRLTSNRVVPASSCRRRRVDRRDVVRVTDRRGSPNVEGARSSYYDVAVADDVRITSRRCWEEAVEAGAAFSLVDSSATPRWTSAVAGRRERDRL